MLLKNGTIKVTDFGIAKLADAETVTMTDKAIGTVYYISPEQASGLPIDCRSDIYSLGAMMYEMATDELPFTGDTPVSVALKQINEEAPLPSTINADISAGFEHIIMTAMEKDADDRYQSADAMLEDIKKLSENPDIVFPPIVHKNKPEDEIDDGKFHLKKLFKSTPMFPIILGISVAFLAICIICGVLLLGNIFGKDNVSGETITVANFVGGEYTDELKKFFKDSDKYTVEVVEAYSSEYAKNTIIKQDPEAGKKVKIQSDSPCKITLTISMGAETYKLPELSLYDYRDAKKLLEGKSIVVKVEDTTHDTIGAGYVVKTEPAAGTELKSGDTVTLFKSTGATSGTISVPDYEGKTEEYVLRDLISHELQWGKAEYKVSDKAAGTIISQSVAPFSVVSRNTSIDFVISGGADYDPALGSEGGKIKTISVENFVGKVYTSEMASQYAASDTYSLSVEYVSSAEAKDTVVKQSPEAGTQAKILKGQIRCNVTLYLSNGSRDKVTLDSYVGQNYADAVNLLRGLGMKPETVMEYSTTVAEGRVIRMTPAAGSTVSEGSTVTLYVSLGAEREMVVMPKVVGMTEDAAKNELTSVGLSSNVTYAENNNYTDGTVIEQSVKQLTTVEKGTTITITICRNSGVNSNETAAG